MKEQFNQIIKSDDLKEITIDLVEKVLDNNIGDDIVKEIPILKSLVAAKKIYNSYTDSIFIKKAMYILLELGEVTLEQRNNLTNDLNDEDCSGAEKILIAIDNLETLEKCKIFGRLCKLKALGEIDVDGFKRLTKLTQDAYIDDLELLPILSQQLEKTKEKKNSIYESTNVYMEEFYPLLGLGLIYQEQSKQTPIEKVEPMDYDDPEPYYKGGEIEMLFYISNLGRILLSFYDKLFLIGK